MKVDIYKSTKASKYMFVKAGTQITNETQMNTTDEDFGSIQLFKKNVDLRPETKRIGISEDETLQVIADLLGNGQAFLD